MSLVVGTAGHIDHGKTALVRALTGVDTDRLEEEKRRGITIDLGFAALNLGELELSLVDVPGHERFVRNMLAGATGIDAFLLVVAADDSVMPQTREHLEILRFLQVRSGIVALTKSDLVDDGWLDLVEEDIRTLLAGTPFHDAPIVRTSVLTGLGIDHLKAGLSALIPKSQSVADTGVFRMAIDRSFTMAGHGTVVTGTIAGGRVEVGDLLELMPEGRPVRVRSIHRHDQLVDSLGRGNRAAINLVGVHHADVTRGHEIATPGYLQPTQILTVELHAARDASRPLKHRSRYRLHLGTQEVTAALSLLEGVAPGTDIPSYGQLRLARPVVAVFGQPFVLREESPQTTVAGGRVLDPVAPGLRRKQLNAIRDVRTMAKADPEARICFVLSQAGLNPRSSLRLVGATGLSQQELETRTIRMRATGGLVQLPAGGHRTVSMPSEFVSALEQRVIKSLTRLHEATPRHSSLPITHLFAAMSDLPDRAILNAILDRMTESRMIIKDQGSIALAGHEPRLTQAERRLRTEIAESFHHAGLAPPEMASFVGTGVNRSKQTVQDLFSLLCEERRLLKLDANLYLDGDAERAMLSTVSEYFHNHEAMTMADLRDLLATTRKYAVPFGEYLDRVGLTVRDGDQRRRNSSYIMPAE